MMNYDEKKNGNIEELDLEAMEDVAGGGIKEIVAGVTLAAMTMTGSPVSAFGIAKAMAEESNAIIEEAPAQEAYGMEYQGQTDVTGPEAPVNEVTLELGGGEAPVSAAAEVSEEADPIVENAAASQAVDMDALKLRVKAELDAHLDEGLDVATGKVYDALLETAPEQAIDQALRAVLAEMDEAGEAPEFYQALEEEAPEEVEAVLDETGATAKPEAEETEAEAADDRDALLNDLINTAMDASQEEGLYAALDNTFSTLAQNASALADPETGVIEADGDQIVSMTFDALSSRFDVEPELLMGAIGAAAARADERGDLQALGGDPALVSMVVRESAANGVFSDKDATMVTIESTMALLQTACPVITPFVKPFTDLFGALFGSGVNIEKKFDEINQHLDAMETALKQNAFNVMQLGNIDNRFVDLDARAQSLLEEVEDIADNPQMSDAVKLQKIANLKSSGEFRELNNALTIATNCFTSTQVDDLANRNLFEAAYQLACGQVMFSGEALDMTVPYLVRQLASYLHGYAALEIVFEAYEQVYGADSLSGHRKTMALNLTGMDLNGKHTQKSVFEWFADYAQRSRFVFVNKNGKGKGIEVSPELGMITLEKGEKEDEKLGKKGLSILSADQVKDLTKYCVQTRGLCLHDYLANKVGFKMDENSVKKTTRTIRPIPWHEETIKKTVVLTGGDDSGYLYWFGYDFWNMNADKQMYTTGIGGQGITFGAITDTTILYFKKA